MLFPSVGLTQSQIAQQWANDRMSDANSLIGNLCSEFRIQWTRFWDPTVSVAQMQANLDALVSVPTKSGASNALADFFTESLAVIAFIQTFNPDAFADALEDSTNNFTQFLSPGWVGTSDPATGRYVVAGPCVFPSQE